LSRFVTAACFLSGVIFFALETATITDIINMQTYGTGAYADRGRKHILVCGGACEAVDSNSLKMFFAELFHPSFKQMSPDAVILVTSNEAVLAVRDFVKTEVESGFHHRIEVLRGSALLAEDLQRCRCGDAVLAVVLADTRGLCNSEEDEDQENILRALSIQQIYPATPMRLQLLCPESQDLAISARIPPQRCVGISRMKASLLWQSCRCVGWNSLIGNLLVTTDSEERTHILSANPSTTRVAPWRRGYVDGLAQEVYGFLPAMEYVGLPLLELVKAAYQLENAIIIAAQVEGKVCLAPFKVLDEVTEDTIIFSLDATLNLDDVNNSVLRAGEWQKVFYTNRRRHRVLEAPEIPPIEEDPAAASAPNILAGLIPQKPTLDIQAMESKALAIRKGGSSKPFVLFIEFADSWRTLSIFLEARGASWHPNKKPLVILAASEPPQELWEKLAPTSDDAIGMVIGSGKSMQVLAKAGVHEANNIVCPAMHKMGGTTSSSPEQGTLLDANAVILYSILGRLELLGKVNVIMEMHRMDNVRLLPVIAPQPGKAGVNRANTLWEAKGIDDSDDEGDRLTEERLENQVQLRMDRIASMSYREMQQAMLVGGQGADSQRDSIRTSITAANPSRPLLEDTRSVHRRSRCWHGCLRRSGYLRFKRALHREAPFKSSFGIQMCGSSKYISGEVFTPAIFGALVARTNYVPGILEVMQALVAPEEASDVFPWQISVREAWVGKTFSEVFHELLEDEHGPALGLGIYRPLTRKELAEDPEAPQGFVWTNPEPETEVEERDRIYVLASSQWGKSNQ